MSRAVASFTATLPAQLSLAPNDFVEILQRHASGWTYGRLVSDASGAEAPVSEGWFPDAVCEATCVTERDILPGASP